ncbi:MAG: T9SS type A sorting domain-containing protein [Tannerella sp.]|nr:T9SS type A sorting domain-containing protein [Tannerella sp.]
MKQSYQTTESLTICASELPYTYHGETFTAAESRNITLVTQNGCDSVIHFTLTVKVTPGIPTVYSTEECEGNPVSLTAFFGTNGSHCNWYAFENDDDLLFSGTPYEPVINSSTTFYVASVSANGCESSRVPVTATIITRPEIPVVENNSRCGTGSITLTAAPPSADLTCNWYTNATTSSVAASNTTIFTRSISSTTTFYVATVVNGVGTSCASDRVAVIATINPVPAAPQVANLAACEGEIKTITPTIGSNGNNCNWYLTSSGAEEPFHSGSVFTTEELDENVTYYISSINDQTNCESTTRTPLSITVNYVQHTSFSDSGCGTYRWNDETYTVSGSYEQTFLSSTGCDSTVNLTLTIYPKAITTIDTTVCGSFVWNGTTYGTSQMITDTLTTVYGCDSIMLINLVVNDVYHFTTQVTACDQYVWHGETLTQSGTDYVKEFETKAGCDSIEYLHLTIHHSTSSDFSAEACDSYTWNGTTYTESGDYTQILATTHHCDSVVTLHLTIYPSYHVIYTESICQGTPYEGYGFTEETPVAGTFDYHRNHTIANDCDSNITLCLTVNPTYNFVTQDVTICEEGSYNFHGRILTEAGTYTHTFQTQYGCDSTYSIVLHVEDAFITEINASICEGEVYAENGFNESIAGIYRDTLPSSIGCDSIIILTLLVNPVYDEVIYDSICEGDVYFEHGFYVETAELAGTITRILDLKSSRQCDSTITLHLTILPSYTETISETICYGESYNGNGFSIPMQVEAGVFTFTNPLITENGCDSTIYLELTVLPEAGESIDTVVCEVFEWNDSIYTASTTIIQTFAKENACDSTFTIRLTVNPSYNIPIFATICEGNAYSDYGFNIIEPIVGFITDTLRHTTVLGCDSITVLHLTVNPVNVESYEETICFGESFDEYGFNLPAQTVSGFFSHIRMEENEFGCQDTVKLMLTVRSLSEIPAADTTDISICADALPYVYNDEYTFTEGGYYVIEASTDNGCLYYYTVNLMVNERYEYRVDSAVCQSELPVYFSGITFHGTTSRTFSFETEQGCDSIIHFSLTVNQVYDNTDMDNVCLEEGDFYHYGNNTFAESGNYPVVFTSVNGCDSTVTLDLTINRIKRGTFNDVACSSYTWNDSTYTTSGTYTQTFTAANGCDSIVTLDLTVNHQITNNFDIEHCDSFVWNDSTYTTSGTYEQTFRAANGCDSTVTMHLTIYESVTNTIHDIACGSYTWNDSIYITSGVYMQELKTINGCDSIVTLHLTIDLPVSSEFFETACGSYTWNDSAYIRSGEYVQRFSTASTCDSVVTLHLTINETMATSFAADACVIYTWDNREYTVSGDYSHTYTGSNGCDSIATLHLTIGQSNTFTFRDTICQYDSYYENGFAIGMQSRTGTFVYDTTVTNVSGCDSIITLTLVVNPSYNTTLTQDACASYTWQDSTYTQSGQYTRHFTTAAGCDSILMLNLTIYQPIRVDIYDTICQGYSYSYLDFDLPAQNWSGDTAIVHRSPITVCDSITTLHLTVNPTYFIRIVDTTGIGVTYNENGFLIEDPSAGIQRDTLFLQTVVGCDSTVQLLLFIMTGINEYENLANINLYPNPASSIVTITADLLINRVDIYNVAGKLMTRREQIQDYRFEHDVTHLAPGVYIFKIHTEQGVSSRKLIVIEN